MDDGYDHKSCNASEKLFYTIIEAAIRWCNLFPHESEILSAMGSNVIPDVNMFPKWGCLRDNALKLLHATNQGQLAYGRDGKTVPTGEHVAHNRLTIQNSDLKAWMTEYYPGQKPAFLFDEIEQRAHAAINKDALIALQADRDALKAELKDGISKNQILRETCNAITAERNSLLKTVNTLTDQLKRADVPSDRAETTYQNAIVALLHFIEGEVPGVGKHQDFKSEAKLIEIISDKYSGYSGLAESTLKHKFAEAKKNFKNQ